MDDVSHITKLVKPFALVAQGMASIPINMPGTLFNKAIKAANSIREHLLPIIRQRKIERAEGRVMPDQDLLCQILSTDGENGQVVDDLNVADKIFGALIAGHETISSACTSVVKYLAEYSQVYNLVYKEQMEIANSKKNGELLNFDDINKMKYSWNVVCEAMRLAPPAQITMREAKVDLNYKGFVIPKGWKIFWGIISTHMSSDFFPNPKRFDPTRFDDTGPAPYTYFPFGAGSRMCPGYKYARVIILVFMHHLVKRFRWEKVIPDEKISFKPLPIPVNGLPIKLYPHSG